MIPIPKCPWCEEPAELVESSQRYRRGDKSLTVRIVIWQCPTGCLDPDGEDIYTFIDATLCLENTTRADAAWREAFGESLPVYRRPGRPTEEPRKELLQVRFSNHELCELDAVRGKVSRSEYVRTLIREKVMASDYTEKSR